MRLLTLRSSNLGKTFGDGDGRRRTPPEMGTTHMGFMVGCYSRFPRTEAVDRELAAMASFYVERGFERKHFAKLGPQCSLGWIWKGEQDSAPPIVETQTGYLFGDLKLYNRAQLVAKLGHSGQSFKNTNDLHLVSCFLDVFGDAAIRDVNGDFVLGRLDRRRGLLRLFRDHLGLRSLYYLAKPDIIYFAQAVPSLLRLPDAPTEPSARSLGAFLLIGAPMMDRTYFDEIRLLQPSQYMDWDGHSLPVFTKYWEPSPSRFSIGIRRQDIVPAFRELLVNAVEARLSRSGGTAFMLSGGLDSSTVTSIACTQHPSEKFLSVTTVLPAGYEGQEKDERSFVDAMSRRFPNLETIFDDGLGADPLESSDDPFIHAAPREDGFAYMTDSMCRKMASRGFEALLGGYGGDDVVSGYTPSFLIESLLRLRLDRAWFEAIRLRHEGLTSATIAKRFVISPLLPLPLLRRQWQHLGVDWIGNKALTAVAFQELDLSRYRQECGRDSMQQFGRTVAQNEAKTIAYHLQNPGVRTDEGELRWGISVRCPLIDVELLEAVLSVPYDLKRDRSQKPQGRLLIRGAAEPFLPKKICKRTSKGHANPHYRARIAESEPRLREAFEVFRSNATWAYLVDFNKVERGLAALSCTATSRETDVLIQNTVMMPYKIGLFLTATERARPSG